MKVVYFFFVSLMLMPFCSCFNSRNAISFNIKQDGISPIQYPNIESPIQKNDLLKITVSSKSEAASAEFNQLNSGGQSSNPELSGYLVTEQGTIQFPVLGVIKAEGLTKKILQDTITRLLSDKQLLLDPVVTVRNLSYRVTVMGEVLRPGVINVPSEKISLLEALGSAGDMTIYANRKNVLLIREENNQRTFKVLNLNSNEIFSSPYFYLKPNDVVYVEPNKTKISSASSVRQWLPVIFSALSLAIVTIYRIK